MTFESMIDVNSNSNANSTNGEEAVVVKVSFGDEMRRVPFQGGAYVALHELVAKMFGLDQAAFVLKYQDEDGDKITMSSDGEVKEALQLAKEKKLLRLFVELKPQVPKGIVPHLHAHYETKGLNQSGLNQSGMNHSGMNHSGMNHSGMNHSGMNHSGMNHSGMNHSGMNQSGMNQNQSGMSQREMKLTKYTVDEAATAPPPPSVELPCGGPFGFGPRFGRGPFGHGPHPHGPHGHGRHGHGPHGPHAHGPHGPHDPHAHGPHGHHGPHRGFHGHHGFRGGRGGFGMRGGFAFHGRFGPVAPPAPVPATEGSPNAPPVPVPQSGDANANFHTPHMFAHGSFSPADGCPFPKDSNGPYAARCAFKEHKHAMKEHIRFMKMNAATPEDFEALKEFKQQMKSECKARWHAMKDAKKEAKKDKKCEKKWDKKMEKCDKHNRPWAKHVADVTIPDNSELPADTPVTKTWRLKNEGNVAWPVDSHLIFVSHKGDNLNGPERVFVGSVEPQQEVDVSVTFITPSQPGRYVGYYRMASGDGDKFGQRVWVSFIIPLTTVAQEVPVTTTTTTTTTATPTAGAPSADVTMD